MFQKSTNKNTTPRSDLKAPQGQTLRIAVLFFAFSIIPEVSLALTFEDLAGFFVGEIVNSVVVLIIGLAVVYFLWGIAKYILHSGDPKIREEGRNMMIYGVIAIFIMVSIWGFVNLLDNTFKLDNSTLPDVDDFLP